MSEQLDREGRLAAALTALICDRSIRRYLAVTDPQRLQQAQRALHDFLSSHG